MKNEDNVGFPCDFPIKIFGNNSENFEITVLSIVKKHFPDIAENALRIRESRNSNYISITVTVRAENKQILDAIYLDLSKSDLVIMVL